MASAGPFKGTSVWQLARKRFEARMWDAGVAFGPPPGRGFPNDLVPDYESDRSALFAELAAKPGSDARTGVLPGYVGRV